MSHDNAQEHSAPEGEAGPPSSESTAVPAVPSPPAGRLTRRELQVLRLLADGRSNKEIAWQLRVSVHMVKAHVSRVLEKLHVASRTEAAVFYIRAGWEHTAPGGREEQTPEESTKKDA